MHSVYVEQVQLPSPLQAEAQFFFLRSAPHDLARQGTAPITLTCPPVEQSPMNRVSGRGTKTASTCYTLLRLPYNTLSSYPGTSKQA